MRKVEREIRGQGEIRAIMEAAQVCRIGLADGDIPYVIPMHFGLGEGCLYLHSAGEGRKLDLLQKNNRVCFEMDLLDEIKKAEQPCRWSAAWRSVIGFGRAVLVEDPAEKHLGLDRIMAHYGARGPFAYPNGILAQTVVIRIDIESITGKHHE